MEDNVRINLELNISAQKIMHQIQLNHGAIEEQIKQGIELAIKDITDGDNLVQKIRESCKDEILKTVNKAVMSWEVQNSISKMVQDKVVSKIGDYADEIAEKITSSLK